MMRFLIAWKMKVIRTTFIVPRVILFCFPVMTDQDFCSSQQNFTIYSDRKQGSFCTARGTCRRAVSELTARDSDDKINWKLKGKAEILAPGGYNAKFVAIMYNSETGERAMIESELSLLVTVTNN